MVHHAPDRVQRGLHRTFHPGRSERHVVAGDKNATLGLWQIVLHEVGVHAVVVAVMAGQRPLERPKKMGIGLPRHGDRVAHDVPGDVHIGVNLAQCREREFDPPLRAVRQHLERVAHPGVGQADHARLVRPVVEQVGAAGEPVGQGHAQGRPAGLLAAVAQGVPERVVDHHKGFGRLHVAGAVQRHPQAL